GCWLSGGWPGARPWGGCPSAGAVSCPRCCTAERAFGPQPPLGWRHVSRAIVISGPSGVGKGTLIRGVMDRVGGLELSVSATTRPPRVGECDGVDYHFLSREEFDRRVAAGEFLEHADYAGNHYGTLPSD